MRALLLSLAFCTTLPAAAELPFLLGGIQVNEADHEAWLDALQNEGMNTVQITAYLKQGDWDSDHLWWDDDRQILAEARAAHARGMRVVLVLRLALDHSYARNDLMWHGQVMPTTDEEVDSWFGQYTVWAGMWARRAAAEGIEVLMIGAELNAMTSTRRRERLPILETYYFDDDKVSEARERVLDHADTIDEKHLWQPGRREDDDLATYLERREAVQRRWAEHVTSDDPATRLEAMNRRRALLRRHWAELIETLRGEYGGLLGYAANFDQYREVGFWHRLDLMGINAYFPLRSGWDPPADDAELEARLVTGWDRVLQDLRAFRSNHGLTTPVLFTEIGYTRRANNTIEPWADTGFAVVPPPWNEDGEPRLYVWREQPPSLAERALAIRALDRVHAGLPEPLLAGVLYWKLSSIPSHVEIEPFVAILGAEPPDPLLASLRRLGDGTVPRACPETR